MDQRKSIPRDKVLDGTIPLLLFDGYEYIMKRCKKYQTDIFQTRLLGKKAICLMGEEGARLFYDAQRFQREGIIPHRIQVSLFGKRGVQVIDGNAHHHRKQLFLSVMTQEKRQELLDLLAEQWQQRIKKWQQMDTIILYNEVQELLCAAVCTWAGIPLQEGENKQRAHDFMAMVDAFGAVGLRYQRGRKARQRAEKWIENLIRGIRAGNVKVPAKSVAQHVAFYTDVDNNLLQVKIAAVELINLLRPTVAITYLITFAAMALYEHPECLPRLQNDDEYVGNFVQEVRRFFPFAPFLGARTMQDFVWHGYEIPKGRMVILDLYGTNHDARIWKDPDQFRPERFQDWQNNAYNFIPQGGGEFETGHRCAGEWLTIEIMKLAMKFLTQHMTYEVPKQDLKIRLTRIPALPESKFQISKIRAVSPTPAISRM